MGILKEPAAFVAGLALRGLPQPFSVCELGNQQMAGGKSAMAAEDFYRNLGCSRYESIDANGLATFTHDLNRPLPFVVKGMVPVRKWSESFDLVTDFGTGEHIFDQAQVWRTLHDLVKPGGYIAFDRPSQGYGKHCFYLTTRTLYEDIAAANRYTIVRLEQAETPRGYLIRGVFRRRPTLPAEPFKVPQQCRYQASSRLEVTA